MGHWLSANGLQVDLEKVSAIANMPEPTDQKAIQRLLGMANYLSKFIPNLADKCEPLRKLVSKYVEWVWEAQEKRALDRLKDAICRAATLQYYDIKKPVTLQTDASSTGLGAVLMQDYKPVTYASRTLTPTEREYAQIEKECFKHSLRM